MNDHRAKKFSDVITFGFWIRKSSVIKLKERFQKRDNYYRLGRGVAFHIAPSNVPVNFAYSLVAGLLMGNANIVRVSGRDYEQVDIIADAINKVLDDKKHMKPYIVLVRYQRDMTINDYFSSIADTRIIWGGDETIREIRKSPLSSRSTEISFAERYSLAVIDSDVYMEIEEKKQVASDFYNDTYLMDQNACTSPKIVIWIGSRKEEAKKLFWEELHKLVEKKYSFQSIQAINKLTSSYLTAIYEPGAKVKKHRDNYVIRVSVDKLMNGLMDIKENGGFFWEYDCDDILELKNICDNKRCQTIAILGDADVLKPLLKSGISGIDRIVPIGKTLDFDLIWDGYDLTAYLTRIIAI